ncbi:hypothetical protein QTP88_009255 [Uroleucon formosanum]
MSSENIYSRCVAEREKTTPLFNTSSYRKRKYPEKFFDYYRMSINSFDELLQKVRESITKNYTQLRNPITLEERLTVTIRYFSYIIKKQNTNGECVFLLYILLLIDKLILKKAHVHQNYVVEIGSGLGLVHTDTDVDMVYFSVVLMAVVDANLQFISIDVGAYGKEGDSNVFKNSNFGKLLYSNKLDLPGPALLPETESNPQPYVFIGDEAFALHTHLLRPYPGRNLTDIRRVFNYRLSRARRMVECAFGVLANKWRVLHTPIQVEPDFTDEIIKACCVLHNFVRKRDGTNFENSETISLEDIEVHETGTRSQGIEDICPTLT